jgi:hypothetical protein
MITSTLEIQSTTYFMRTEWEGNIYPTDVTLCYRNEATDHWNSSYEVTIDIDKAKALEIIEFLKESFGLPT